MLDWEPLAKRLAEEVAAAGSLDDPTLRRAMAETPRHVFVPRFWELGEYNTPQTLVDGANPAQHDQWLQACYADRPLITHWIDTTTRRALTSSASMPSLVARMLRALDVREGQRVLEIGVGTGWNAALLCHRLGDQQVVSVDIDAVIVAEAESHLASCGYTPVVETADGAAGLAHAGPYDRILCTCSTGPVPRAWIEQLNDHGRIVAPLTFGGALAVLDKTGPGEVSGTLDPEQAYFMPLHAPGEPAPEGLIVSLPQPGDSDPDFRTTTDIPLQAWAESDFRLWLALHLPECRIADLVDDNFERNGVVIYTATNRATVDYSQAQESLWPVTQDQARLWNTVEATWRLWHRYGRPDRTRIGITARVDGTQYVWLDQPDGPIRWPLPAV